MSAIVKHGPDCSCPECHSIDIFLMKGQWSKAVLAAYLLGIVTDDDLERSFNDGTDVLADWRFNLRARRRPTRKVS